MLPLSLLRTAAGHPMLVELKNGETYNGELVACDNWMNISLRGVICTSRDGDRFWKLAEVTIRGNNIKYLRIPEEVIDMVPVEEETRGLSPVVIDLGRKQGRFGMMGSRGGFLPREALGSTKGSFGAMLKSEGDDEASVRANIDFCGFLAESEHAMYVGVPSNASVCTGMCVGIDVIHDVKVTGMRRSASGAWALTVSGGGASAVESEDFAAVVIASHDASLAASAVQVAASDADVQVAGRLEELARRFQQQRQERTEPCFTWSGFFPVGFSACVPLDAAVAPSSHVISFVARDASKPGRPVTRACDGGEGELWTAVSTASFAQSILARAPSTDPGDSGRGSEAATVAAQAMSQELARLFAPYFGDELGRVPQPLAAAAKRWGAGFAKGTCELKESAVTLEPWRLAVAGDYLQVHASPIEAAAVSGLDAGPVTDW
ncbi:u6 snRNA-associated sm-like protein lsm4 [Chrysochromulina tobinii]|uniref:U6 snRNA-associated sm-like protein lsm4 n=1 Tax=Chrysochromulina tobinii TaxID=1460289 RepID=A0A0M0JAW3_9EUKA|nr:u6 snRNA-associated sm-like protein lsm4 [Chrysochromulina tobinii]|eukprot:KOO23477.1 u6 snRNA-associated sm-like protein lsm4 [Chrysochromulina sp. CCMP291]